MSPEFAKFGERFVDLVPWFLDEATVEPHSLVHGDYRLDNLFFGGPGEPPLTVVDWQICFKGRPGYDVGYFLSQSLATDVRREHESALLDTYLGSLGEFGIDYPKADFDSDYRRTIAYCFIYPIVATGQIELSNERQRQLVEGMLDRAVAAIDDTNALALVPQ